MGGQILGDRYEVERQLGKKAGRWTLQARDLKTQESVILKVLFLDDNLTATDLKLFTREVEALKLLKHPATPHYQGYFEMDLPSQDRAMTSVQSYIEGISLKEYLESDRTFKQSEIIEIARQTLKILEELHTQSPPIIHRDIRPSNILLQPKLPVETAKVCLVDFGTVKSLTSGTTAFTMVGTDGYLPPEQAGGRALAVSDLYSLGATLVESMTGISPSQMQTRGLRIHFEEHVETDPTFTDWLKKLLSPSLEHRWDSAKRAIEALDALGHP